MFRKLFGAGVLAAVLMIVSVCGLCACGEEGSAVSGKEVFVPAGKSASFRLSGDGKTEFSFEYKVPLGEGAFGVALIDDDWGKNYFGYYYFYDDGAEGSFSGITVTDLDDGFKKVTFRVDKLNVLTGNQKPDKVKTMYIRGDYTEVDVIIRNVG